MKRKYLVSVCVLTIILIFPVGCEREEFKWGNEIGNIIYSGNTVFLAPAELALLKEVTDNKIVFGDVTGEIGKITEEKILIMGISEKTPYGSLRKVTSIERTDNEIIISTTDALLTDAIKEGTIKLQKRLLEKDFTLKTKVEGVLVNGPDKAFDGLAVTLVNFEIFKDGTRIARLNGSIGISPEIDITIKIESNKIKEINLVTALNMIDEITVTSNGAFNGVKEAVAAEFIHSPIIIDSLVFIPEVTISCGFDGTILCQVTSGVRQDRVVTSNMNYINSNWSQDPIVHTESFDYIVPQITDNSDLKIFSGPEIKIMLFGIPVQTVKAEGYYSLEAEKTVSPFWKLFIGNEGYNTVESDILGISEDYSLNMAIQASEIGNANGK